MKWGKGQRKCYMLSVNASYEYLLDVLQMLDWLGISVVGLVGFSESENVSIIFNHRYILMWT